jgi:uncharacterized ferredoxin-like protein
MKLIPNWQDVALYSWAFRINLIIAVTSAADAAVSYMADGKFAWSLGVAAVSLIASGARLVKQVTISGEDE